MIDLERSLEELAERLEVPGEAWLAADVVRRIESLPRVCPGSSGRASPLPCARSPRLVLVVVPGPRRAIARWLGFDSVRIEPAVTMPTTTSVANESTAITSSAPGLGLDLGPSVPLGAALATTGLPDPTPQLLGTAKSVHVQHPPAAGQIVLVYPPSELVPQSSVTGVGALMSVLPATVDDGFFQKMLGVDATVQAVDVDGSPGYWLEGTPHQMLFVLDGEVQADTLRLATNTLLWQRDGRVYRLEADVSLEVAQRIAASVP